MPATRNAPTLSPDGTITIAPEDIVNVAIIRTPNEKFTGVRNRIKFVEGTARMPEPKVEDFDDGRDWENEHKVWEQTTRIFRQSGYAVTIQKIALMGLEDGGIPI